MQNNKIRALSAMALPNLLFKPAIILFQNLHTTKRLNLLTSLIALSLMIVSHKEVDAQAVPDNTLGVESSTIRSVDDLREVIEGGAIRGSNLFHSFEQFVIQEGARIDFANPDEVSNIFSRVTGRNMSEIFGTLGVDGGANLFLMNPNGIIFGENAAVDVGGSFIATTAESIEFESGDRFSSVNSEKSTLTISFPVGLDLGSGSGNLTVRNVGSNLDKVVDPINPFDANSQLSLGENKTLALIGSPVVFDGGIATVDSGRIEIASVDSGIVGFDFDSKGIKLIYDRVSVFDNINFRNLAFVGIINEGEGYLTGNNIFLEGTSNFGSVNFADGTKSIISIEANSLSISDSSIVISNNFNGGRGANLFLKSNTLRIDSGGTFGSTSQGIGMGGDVFIDSDKITVSGISELGFPSSTISASVADLGNAGNITVDTSDIAIEDGAAVSSSTIGSGAAGSVTINSSESIKVKGISNINGVPSQIIAGGNSSEIPESISLNLDELLGESGSIAIATPNLQISDGAQVTVRNSGSNDAGNLEINASAIALDNAAQISASTVSGQGGNITLNTEKLELLNQSQITSSAGGMGDGGNIAINADTILGIENSDITADAIGGDGGNVSIDSNSVLGLQARSQSTDFSDITASSQLGLDGNIQITSPNLFSGESIVSFVELEIDSSQAIVSSSCFNNNTNNAGVLRNLGKGGLPENPENFFDREEMQESPKSQVFQTTADSKFQDWQWGDPVVEANIVKTMSDGTQYLASSAQLKSIEDNICQY